MNGYAPPGGAGRPQSRGEEVANAASHGAALAAALVAGYWLVAWGRSLSAEGFAGVCVFVATMVWLYFASTVYHALPQGRAKRVFLKLDHGDDRRPMALSTMPAAATSHTTTSMAPAPGPPRCPDAKTV